MDFNPQIVFKKQPMVYIAIAIVLIIGVLLNQFLNASSMISLIATLLLIILLMIVIGFSITSFKNGRFYKSLDEVRILSEKSVEFTGIVTEKTDYLSGQRLVLRNIQLLSKDIIYENDAKYIVYPSEKKIEGVILGDILRGGGKWQLFNDKLTDNDFSILLNDRESIKSDVLKMSYPKQIPQNFNEFLDIVEVSKIIITGARTSKNSPTTIELSEIIDSELFFTDSVGAVWLYSDGINQFEVKDWK